MEFEDDPAKAVSNLKKHKVSFEEATSVFGDPMAYTFADPDHSIGEERRLMFGLSRRGVRFKVMSTHEIYMAQRNSFPFRGKAGMGVGQRQYLTPPPS